MVDIRATGADQKAHDEAAAQRLAELREWEEDVRLINEAIEEVRSRHENRWIGAYKGVLHIETSLDVLLNKFGAAGRLDIGVTIVFVYADGDVKVIR